MSVADTVHIERTFQAPAQAVFDAWTSEEVIKRWWQAEHHWVWAVPVALVLWERSRVAAAAWTAVFVARPILWPPWGDHREYGWSATDHAVGNAYVLAALALAVWAAIALANDVRRLGGPRPTSA